MGLQQSGSVAEGDGVMEEIFVGGGELQSLQSSLTSCVTADPILNFGP